MMQDTDTHRDIDVGTNTGTDTDTDIDTGADKVTGTVTNAGTDADSRRHSAPTCVSVEICACMCIQSRETRG